jgi:hypothetical protein
VEQEFVLFIIAALPSEAGLPNEYSYLSWVEQEFVLLFIAALPSEAGLPNEYISRRITFSLSISLCQQ